MKRSELKKLIHEVINETTYGTDPRTPQSEYKRVLVLNRLGPSYEELSRKIVPQAAIGLLDDLIMAAYKFGREDAANK